MFRELRRADPKSGPRSAPPESLHPVQGAPEEVRCQTDQRDVVGVARRQKALRRTDLAVGTSYYPLHLTVQGGAHGAAVDLTPSRRSVPNPDLRGGVCRCKGRSARANLALARSTPCTPGG